MNEAWEILLEENHDDLFDRPCQVMAPLLRLGTPHAQFEYRSSLNVQKVHSSQITSTTPTR